MKRFYAFVLAALLAFAFAAHAAVGMFPWGPKPQFVDANGAPMSSGTVTFYAAGSTTPQNTYTDSTGGVANSNPVTLNSRGETPNEVWLTVGLAYKVVLKDAGGATVWTVDQIRPINDVTITQDEWVASALTPTYVSATSFTLAGDQTVEFHVGRRLKSTNSGGVRYSTILTSAFAAVTTITVVNDSGSLDSGLSALSLGLVRADNTSHPLLVDTYPAVSGSSDKTKKLRFELDTNVPTATTVVATIGAGGLLPPGIGCLPYAGSSVPTGWLECDGSAVSRTTYAALFTAISTTWGVGDGASTFNLPDMRGRAAVGAGTGTVAETVAAASVSTGSDTFTVTSNNTKWITGQAVVLTTSGTLPTGLSLATTYYVVRNSATTIKFSTSLANSQNGTVIDITSQGTGNHTVTGTLTARALGETGGEESHAMTITELLAHTHTESGHSAYNTTAGADGAGASAVVNTGSTGGNAAMNVMQPYAVMKFIISYLKADNDDRWVESIGIPSNDERWLLEGTFQ